MKVLMQPWQPQCERDGFYGQTHLEYGVFVGGVSDEELEEWVVEAVALTEMLREK